MRVGQRLLASPCTRKLPVATLLLCQIAVPNGIRSARAMSQQEYYRSDGVRIHHDPYAPGMASKYGRPGETDADGFDPYADSVGPGIYGGRVRRDANGRVILGQQYQNHNPELGPCLRWWRIHRDVQSTVAGRFGRRSASQAGPRPGKRNLNWRCSPAAHVRHERPQPARHRVPDLSRRRHRGPGYVWIPPVTPHGLKQSRCRR